jgi:GMP synthase-like glutamine amidotransferase
VKVFGEQFLSQFMYIYQLTGLRSLLGICFGHQIIGRAVGGECVPNDGKWEVGTTTVDLSPVGQKLFGSTKLVSLSS